MPTYHWAYGLRPEVEAVLARSEPRLRFLDAAHTKLASEGLIPFADALITVNSTSAMAAILNGKPAVAVGVTPLRAWCTSRVAAITEPPRATRDEVLALLAFLTNRYAHRVDVLRREPDVLTDLFDGLIADADPAARYFDFAAWSPARARSLFGGAAERTAAPPA